MLFLYWWDWVKSVRMNLLWSTLHVSHNSWLLVMVTSLLVGNDLGQLHYENKIETWLYTCKENKCVCGCKNDSNVNMLFCEENNRNNDENGIYLENYVYLWYPYKNCRVSNKALIVDCEYICRLCFLFVVFVPSSVADEWMLNATRQLDKFKDAWELWMLCIFNSTIQHRNPDIKQEVRKWNWGSRNVDIPKNASHWGSKNMDVQKKKSTHLHILMHTYICQ